MFHFASHFLSFFLRNSSHHSLISLPLLFLSFFSFFFEITLVFTTICEFTKPCQRYTLGKKSKCPFSCSIVKIIEYTLALVIHSLSFCISLLVNIILQDSDCSIFFFSKNETKDVPKKNKLRHAIAK